MKKYFTLIVVLVFCLGCKNESTFRPDNLSLFLKTYESKSVKVAIEKLIQNGYKIYEKLESKIVGFNLVRLKFIGDYLVTINALENDITELSFQSIKNIEINKIKESLIQGYNFKLDQQFYRGQENLRTSYYSDDKTVAKLVTVEYKNGNSIFCSLKLNHKNPLLKYK